MRFEQGLATVIYTTVLFFNKIVLTKGLSRYARTCTCGCNKTSLCSGLRQLEVFKRTLLSSAYLVIRVRLRQV